MSPRSLFGAFAAACCASTLTLCAPVTRAAETPGAADFEQAITSARSGQPDAALAALERAFAGGYATPSVVLTHPAFRPLVADSPRRARLNRLLRAHARESKIAIVPSGEAGTPLRFVARLQDARTGAPVPRAFVYLYHTDRNGYYDRDPTGRERGPDNARMFGVARSDEQGRIEVRTVVPGSYPGGGFRHIHYFIRAQGYEDSMREVILDEDPRPSPQQKEWAARNGDVVARRSVGKDGVSSLDVTLRIEPHRGRS